MSSSKVTQSQVAREANVTQGVVSVILSGSDTGTLTVSESTKARVLEVAERLGYVSRKTAPKARGRRQNVLLVENFFPSEIGEQWVSAGYESLMGKIVGMTSQLLEAHGMGIAVHHMKSEGQSIMQWLAESDTCGVIWHGSENNPALQHWIASRYPMVTLNRSWRSSVPIDAVSVDQEMNVTLAAEHLWSMGHRKIATFGHNPNNSIFRRRTEAYRQFVQERSVRDYREFQQLPDDQEVSALQKVQAILDTWQALGEEAPTALIISDVFALRLLGAAKERGISIPGELSLVGIDNTAPAALVDPALTSVEEPFDEVCRNVVRLLIRRIENPNSPTQTVQIAPRLIARQSVRRIENETFSMDSVSLPAESASFFST